MRGRIPRLPDRRVRKWSTRRRLILGGILLVTLVSLRYGYASGWDRFLAYRQNPFQGRTVEQRLLHSLTKRGRKVAAATPEAVSGVDLVTLPDGQVLDATVPSPTLGRSLGYRIYLPPGYDDPRLATMRYPVMYLLHGAPGGERDWVDGASANQTADALIKSGTSRPSSWRCRMAASVILTTIPSGATRR